MIDYATRDFTRGSERCDLIVDIPGNHSFAECRRVLAPDGTYVLIGHDGYGATAGRWLGSLPRVLPLVAMAPFRASCRRSTSRRRTRPRPWADRHVYPGRQLNPLIDRTYH